jgi:hypothetical protein
LINFFQVVPAHLAFVLLNDGHGEQAIPGGMSSGGAHSLFASVVEKAGGDPVSGWFSYQIDLL